MVLNPIEFIAVVQDISSSECSTTQQLEILALTKFPVRAELFNGFFLIAYYRQILDTPANKSAITSAEEVSLSFV